MRGDLKSLGAGLLSLLLSASASLAGEPVGRVVAARGTVEVARGGEEDWRALPVAAPVFTGDRLRTGEDGLVKILFDDESVVDVGGGSATLEIDRYDVDPAATEPRSVLRLGAGAVLARVSEFYAAERWRWEIETPTAVTRARGKTLVRYDPSGPVTEVVCFDRGAQVRGVLGVIGPAVDLEAGQHTRAQQGKFPTPPETLDAAALAERAQPLFLVGTGENDSLDAGSPLLAGRLASDDDRIAAGAPSSVARRYLDPGPPGETLQDTLSPDLRANTQPIPEYKRVPPGEPPTGGVEVDF